MSEDRPLPSTVMGQELLSQLKKAPEQTLYGLALSGQNGDREATRILCHFIRQQQFCGHLDKGEFETHGVKSLIDRSRLAAYFSSVPDGEVKVPKALKALFSLATGLTAELAVKHEGKFFVASPDGHHFNVNLDTETGNTEFIAKSLAHLPAPFHFATLFMNPYNPANLNDPELPLQDGRMEQQIKIVSECTGASPKDLIDSALANALHIAAWRFNSVAQGKASTQDQAMIDYFIRVARVANHLAGNDQYDRTFSNAQKAVRKSSPL